MTRLPSFFATLALVAAPAAASSYSATLSAPTSARYITRDIVWDCGAAACQGSTDESRPLVLCESLAKRAGTIQSFLVDGRALPAGDLARCNAAARPGASQPLASK